MGKITGNEPKHWHDENGRHRMPDPRRLAQPQPVMRDGQPTGEMSAGQSKATICSGDPDLAKYWDHLDAHDQMAPERRNDDSPQVRAMFDTIESNEAQNKTMRELIAALRANDQ